MSHYHKKVEEIEYPVKYLVTDTEGVKSVQWLYLHQVDSLIELGCTVKEMRG